MFIAHLPAGYLISKYICQYLPVSKEVKRKVMVGGLIGSIAPDFDLFYLSLIDNYQVHHHGYWSHYPVTWLLVLFVALGLFRVFGQKWATFGLFVFSLNGFFHLILDSMTGEIRWLIPFDSNGYSLMKLQAVYTPWMLNFLLHWTFLVEILILLLFCRVLYRSKVSDEWLKRFN